jgi:hypothetical protein
MTERKAGARKGDSRFLAALGMTISFGNCQRKAKGKARQRQGKGKMQGQRKMQIPAG